MADLSITGEVVVTSEKAEGAFDRVGAKAGQMASKVQAEATKAGAAVDNIGTGAEKGAEKFTRAESRMREAIMKSTRELEMLGKTASQKFEAQLDFKGLDKAKFQPVLDDLRKMEEATKKAETGFTGMGTAAQMAGRALAAIGIGASVREFVAMADASTNMASKLALVTGSTAELAQVHRRLFDVAQASRVGFVGLADTYTQFARSTKDLGVSQTALLDITKTISQAITISGGSAASAQAALVQLGQGFASGALRGEELNSVLEQTPRLAQAIADGLGVGIGKLREMGSNGELTAEKVLGALQKAAAGIESEFARMTPTIEQSLTKITNSMTRLVGEIDKGVGATSKLSSALGLVSGGIDFLAGDISKLNSQGALRAAADEVLRLDGMAKRLRNTMDSGIVGPNAQANLDALMAKLAEAKARFRELDAQLGGNGKDPRDQSGFTGRGVSYANEAARQAKLREDANAFRLNQAGVPASYLKDMAELIRLNQAGVIVGKEYTDALKAQQDLLLKKTTTVRGSAAAATQEQNAYESLISSIRAKIEADKLEIAGGTALTESQRLRIKLDQDLAAGRIKLGSAHEKSVRLALEELSASEAAALAAKTLSKANADAAQAREKYLTSLASGVDKIKADTAAQIEATARLGLSKEAIADLDAAKLEMLATDLELQAIKAMDRNLDEQTYNALKQQAEAYRELAAAKKAGATKEMALDLEKANLDAAKKAADEWQRAADDINRSLTDALMRGFESGKDFAENLRDTLKNMFSTLVLRPVISAVMSPVAGAVNGMVGGAMNSMGLGQFAGQAGQSILGNVGSSLISSGLGSTIAGGIGSAAGAIFGVGAGNVALGSSLGLGIGSSTAAATAAAAAGGASTAGAAAMGSALSSAAAAIPYIGAVIAIASILSGMDDSGTYHTGGAAQYSADKGLSSGQSGANFDIGFGRVEAGEQTISAVGTLAKGLGDALDGIAVSFGQSAGYEIATAFADDTSKDGAWGALRISKDGKELLNWDDARMSKWAPKDFADGEEGYKQYLAAVAKDTRQVLLDMDLPSWADKMLESIGDSASMEQLTGVLNQIGVVQSAFVALGNSMSMFADLTDEMQSGLLDAAGSIEALTAGAGAFYQGFYSEQERIDAAVAQLNETMAGLDLSIDPRMGDDAKDQFRAAVEAAFAAGDAELAAALLAISGNFASAADYFEQLSETAAQAAETAAQAAEAAARSAKDAALRDLQNAISRDRNALQDQASTLQETISGISSAVDMLRSNAAELYGTVEDTAQALAARGMVYVEQALAGVQAGGSVLDYTGLESAISAARTGVSSGVYASQFERERDALVLAGQLSQLGDLSDLQLSVEERQLKAINEQIEYLDSLNDRAQAMVDGTAALTESVDTYFQQLLDLMKEPEEGENKPLPVSGIGGGGGFSSGPGSSAPVTPYNPIDDIKDLYNQTLDPAALRTTMWIRGWTVEQMAEAAGVEVDWARDYLNQDLPKFAVGTNYVPKDMAAIVHEGEAIVPKAFNPWANGGAMGSDTSALIAEVRALREEVAALRASGQAIAENTSGTPQMVRQFDQVTQGGNAIRNKALA